jgi:hypothetical protein
MANPAMTRSWFGDKLSINCKSSSKYRRPSYPLGQMLDVVGPNSTKDSEMDLPVAKERCRRISCRPRRRPTN